MLNQQFVDAMYHLGKIVNDYQNCVLEAIISEDVALVHLIPAEMYDGLEDFDDDCE